MDLLPYDENTEDDAFAKPIPESKARGVVYRLWARMERVSTGININRGEQDLDLTDLTKNAN